MLTSWKYYGICFARWRPRPPPEPSLLWPLLSVHVGNSRKHQGSLQTASINKPTGLSWWWGVARSRRNPFGKSRGTSRRRETHGETFQASRRPDAEKRVWVWESLQPWYWSTVAVWWCSASTDFIIRWVSQRLSQTPFLFFEKKFLWQVLRWVILGYQEWWPSTV